MNVTVPKKDKLSIKAVILYTVSIISCIIAIVIIILSMYYGSEELDTLITLGGSSLTQQDIDYQTLLAGFNDIFQNQLEENNLQINISKENENEQIVYTYYSKQERQENNYDLDLNIPYINISNETIQNYNQEIKETYENKAEEILQKENSNSIYTVEYEATIENNILSLIIRANLKEDSNPQRVIIQTYNYDLTNNREVTLQEMLEAKQLKVNEVENKIKDEITSEQQRVEDLQSLGYDIFERNPEDKMYNVENSKEFFMKDGNIYIIYAYGNENFTSEMDLIIV